jgi:hypothetical protein
LENLPRQNITCGAASICAARSKNEFVKVVGHQNLGRLLAYQGDFDEAAQELKISTQYWNRTNHKQVQCLDESYRALRSLLKVTKICSSLKLKLI